MILLAVDPGLRYCGMAVFDYGALVWAGLSKSPSTERGPAAWVAMAQAVTEAYPLMPDVLLIEQQQVYGGQGYGAADLLELAGVAGAVAGLYADRGAEVTGVLPRVWTGGVPKEVRQLRLLERLTDEERAVIENHGALTHNVVDAVDMGRWYVRTKEAVWTHSTITQR